MFDSKEHLEGMMLDDYNDRKLEAVEFYKLGKSSPLRCGEIKRKHYRQHGELYYFELRAPSVRYTAAKFASSTLEPLTALRNMIQDALQPANVFSFPKDDDYRSSPIAGQREDCNNIDPINNIDPRNDSYIDPSLSNAAPVSFGRIHGSMKSKYSAQHDEDDDNFHQPQNKSQDRNVHSRYESTPY
jgi:hypothetical protein